MLLVDTELPAGAHTNMQPYAGRGWCVMEYNASGLVKNYEALISLKGLTGEETDLREVRANGKAARAPPVAPAPFASTLEAGVASGTTKFTNRGDVPVVAKIYGWAFVAEMAAVVALEYGGLHWDDAQVLTLCAAVILLGNTSAGVLSVVLGVTVESVSAIGIFSTPFLWQA